jgi:hypothetical protein
LPSEHDEGVFVDHVQSNEPDATVDNCVEDDPGISFNVQLLDGGSVPSSLIADGVDISVAKRAAIGSSHSLLQAWQRLLLHGADLEVFALLQILSFQGSTDYVNEVFELGDSEIDPIVHHLSQSLESLGGDIEKQNLRAWNIGGPIELVGFIPSDDEDVALVNHNDFTFADFLVKNFETSPF